MDLQELLASLRREFPGRNIVSLPPDDPKEIVVELDRDVASGTAIALIKRSEPHLHRRMKERYVIEEGKLLLCVNGNLSEMIKGDQVTIMPGLVHHAVSLTKDFVRVRVTSEPPWSPEDHILTNQPQPEPS
jgi:mannose-6-phosphate isomerase-like protein (cupin superfamily)